MQRTSHSSVSSPLQFAYQHAVTLRYRQLITNVPVQLAAYICTVAHGWYTTLSFFHKIHEIHFLSFPFTVERLFAVLPPRKIGSGRTADHVRFVG